MSDLETIRRLLDEVEAQHRTLVDKYAPGSVHGVLSRALLSGVGAGRQVASSSAVPSTTPVSGAPPRIHFSTASR